MSGTNNRVRVVVAGVTSSILREVEPILEKCGLRWEATPNQRELITMLSQKPRIVITTLNEAGLELLRDIRRYFTEAEVLLLESGGNGESVCELAIRAGLCGGRLIPRNAFDCLEVLIERLATSNESGAGVRRHPRQDRKRIKIPDAKRRSKSTAYSRPDDKGHAPAANKRSETVDSSDSQNKSLNKSSNQAPTSLRRNETDTGNESHGNMKTNYMKTAMPLFRLIVVTFGLLALGCIAGGIYAISNKAIADTTFDFLGFHLKSGHVGVAFVGIGLATA